MIVKGSYPITDIYYGDIPISEVWYGSRLVYKKHRPTPEPEVYTSFTAKLYMAGSVELSSITQNYISFTINMNGSSTTVMHVANLAKIRISTSAYISTTVRPHYYIAGHFVADIVLTLLFRMALRSRGGKRGLAVLPLLFDADADYKVGQGKRNVDDIQLEIECEPTYRSATVYRIVKTIWIYLSSTVNGKSNDGKRGQISNTGYIDVDNNSRTASGASINIDTQLPSIYIRDDIKLGNGTHSGINNIMDMSISVLSSVKSGIHTAFDMPMNMSATVKAEAFMWLYPIVDGDSLIIRQAYNAAQTSDNLEIE